jgi:hypothetical protein
MRFSLNTSEMLDWQEIWCFRCQNDHTFSHTDQQEKGCPLIARSLLDEDVAEFQPRDPDWWRSIPAVVSCAAFKVCDDCPPEADDAERRGGETFREFHDRIRTEMLAMPTVADV